jgi:hypothetical protein
VTRYRGDQIIFKGIKLGRRQIRAVMDEDELQALLGAVGAVFFPNKRSKKLMSLPPRQFLDALPEAALMIQDMNGTVSPFSAGNITESLPGPALLIERHRRAAVGTDDDVFILGHNADQFDCQQVEHIIRGKHVAIFTSVDSGD